MALPDQPQVPSVDPIPTPPLRTEAPADFTPKADTFLASWPKMVTQFNNTISKLSDLAAWVKAVANAAFDSATASDSSAKASAASAQQSSGFADASKASADASAASLASSRVVQSAVENSAGLPPGGDIGSVLRIKNAQGEKEWWKIVLSQVGDTVTSTQAPDTNWVPTGAIYPQSLYPALYTKLGKIPDFRDDQFQTFSYPGGSNLGVGDWAYGNGVLFGMGIPASTNTYSIFYSRDLGATWTVLGKAANYYVSQIAFGNNIFVAPDNGGSVVSVLDTTNNQTFNYNLPSTNNWSLCAFGNNVFITIGTGGQANNQARSLDNAKTWQASTFPSDMVNPANLVFFNGMFMVFSGTASFPYYYTSTDGLSWTKRNAPAALAYSRRNMAVANGALIAVDGNTTYKTTNGINWTNNSGGNPFVFSTNLYVLGGGDNVFIAAAAGSATGKLYFSVDGFNWSFRNKLITPTTQSANIPIFANGNFLIHVSNVQYAWKIKPYSYNTASQFYTTDVPVNSQIGLTQYIRGA